MVRPKLFIWLIGAVLLFCALQYFNEHFLLTFFLFYMIIPFVSLVDGLILKRFMKTDMNVRSDTVVRGETAEWIFSVKNTHYFQTMALRVSLKEGSVSSKQGRIRQPELLLPRSSKSIKILLRSQHTGPLRCGRVDLQLRDVGGFFRFKKFDSLKTDNFPEILVLPKRLPSSQMDNTRIGRFDADMATAVKQESQTDEIDRMRQMKNGDRLRDIHWKLSARLGEWMVRQYEKAGEKSVRLFLDLPEIYFDTINRESERLLLVRDLMLDTAYTATEDLVSRQVSITLKTYSPLVLEQQIKHVGEIDLIRRQLAMIDFRKVFSLEEMVHTEIQSYTHQLIYLLTYRIDEDMIALLKVLQSRVQGLHIDWFIDGTTDRKQVRDYLKQLKMAEIDTQIVNTDRFSADEVIL